MKKSALQIILTLSCFIVHAQDQFTNNGNVQTFAGASITFFGNFANNGTFVDAQAVTFKGTANQNISGTSITTFYDLVGNSSTGVTLQQDVIITNSLVLTTGQLNLNSKTLTINNSASTGVSRTGGYILSESVNNSSKVKWNIGSTTGPHVFPFGTASAVYIPFTLDVTAGDIGNVTVSTYTTAADNTPYPILPVTVTDVDRYGSDNSANVVDRFWQIDKDGVSGTASLTFEAAPAEVGTLSTLLAQRWNVSTPEWEEPITGQISTANGVTVSGVTSFSPWTLSGNNAILPIELLSFTAKPLNSEVQLDWKTATEINNHYFTIERSKDGLAFSDVAQVSAGGNGHTLQKYSYVDINALDGKSYYRLKQTDFDGHFKFSEIRIVRMEEPEAGLTAYPNPVTNGELFIDFFQALPGPTSVTVYDVMGRIVIRDVVATGTRTYSLNFGTTPPGVYVIKTFNSESTFQQTIVVK